MTRTYRPLPSGRTLTIVGIVVSWGAALAVLLLGSSGFGFAFALGAALSTVVFGWRTAQEVDLTADGELVWRSLLGGGRASLADVRRVRPTRWQRTFLYVEVDGARGPVVPSGRGIAAFVDALRSARPDVDLDLGAWVTRLVELDRARTA